MNRSRKYQAHTTGGLQKHIPSLIRGLWKESSSSFLQNYIDYVTYTTITQVVPISPSTVFFNLSFDRQQQHNKDKRPTQMIISYLVRIFFFSFS